MTYYGAKELAEAFRTVRNNTLTIAEEIPEDKFSFRASPDTRTVAEMLVHIALAPRFPMEVHGTKPLKTFEGYDFMAFFGKLTAEAEKPRNKAQVIALLREEGDRAEKFLSGLSDSFLGERVKMMPGMTPESKTRFEMLLSVKEHEMHHRSQLMMIERMVGIVPHLTRQMEARMAEMTAAAATAGKA